MSALGLGKSSMNPQPIAFPQIRNLSDRQFPAVARDPYLDARPWQVESRRVGVA